jgi:carbonic anhydrase
MKNAIIVLLAGFALASGVYSYSVSRTTSLEQEYVRHKPSEVLDGEHALSLLKAGNVRFRENLCKHPNQTIEIRRELLDGQHPFAVVVGCSDSRVPPDLLFDCGFGDLFVIRVAGNVVDTDELASIEYAVDHLDTKLVVVLGHYGCGAVTASLDEHSCEHEPEEICELIEKIRQNVGDFKQVSLPEGVEANVLSTVEQVKQVEDIKKAMSQRGVVVQPAVYSMKTGEIKWLAE